MPFNEFSKLKIASKLFIESFKIYFFVSLDFSTLVGIYIEIKFFSIKIFISANSEFLKFIKFLSKILLSSTSFIISDLIKFVNNSSEYIPFLYESLFKNLGKSISILLLL